MTAPIVRALPHRRALAWLAALTAVAVVIALLTPEAVDDGGGLSSHSVGAGGARISFELSRRMGWNAQRRTTPFDSTSDSTSVQVIIAPASPLGARETHRLLDHVRSGGGLIIADDAPNPITDSLGLWYRREGRWVTGNRDARCRDVGDVAFTLPPSVRELVWRRPAPGAVTELATTGRAFGPQLRVGVGVQLGRGRVAVIAGPGLFRNDVLRLCPLAADVVIARAFEYVRPYVATRPILVFDEYHHGFGEHAGSMSAVARFLGQTSSGRFLFQAMIAGLVLLLAKAPRPIVPRDPERVARRSPLEHADALGQAYLDVQATRTATAHLIRGLRRRVGRVVAVGNGASDEVFLDAVVDRHPNLRTATETVRRALHDSSDGRGFSRVGDALRGIEQQLTSSLQLSS